MMSVTYLLLMEERGQDLTSSRPGINWGSKDHKPTLNVTMFTFLMMFTGTKVK